jgi:hypothetical protein
MDVAEYEAGKAEALKELTAIADEVAGSLCPFDFEREAPKHRGKYASDWVIRFRLIDPAMSFHVTTPRTIAVYRGGVIAGHLEVAPGNVAAQVVAKVKEFAAAAKLDAAEGQGRR